MTKESEMPGENRSDSKKTPLSPEKVRQLVSQFEKRRSSVIELRKEIKLLYALLDAAKGLNSISDITKLIEYLVTKAIEVSEAEKGFIVVQSVFGEGRTFAATSNGETWDPEKDGFSKSVVDQVLENGRMLVLDEESKNIQERKSAFELSLRSIACIPLKDEEEMIGALYIHSREGISFGPTDIRVLRALTELAVIAIMKAVISTEREKARKEVERLNAELQDKLEYQQEELEKAKEVLQRHSSMFRTAESYGGLIGVSHSMKELVSLMKSLESTDLPILITGESGTGKELVANAIHSFSTRASGPFLAINCGAMPNSLLSAELFGYKKGAFTGATDNRRGLFELANSGTLFLDEVVSMSPDMQKSLLRVLERGEVMPLGSEKAIKVDVRVIAAANTDAKTLIAEKVFREDLFYRLAVVTLHLPPLRERREDIPYLIEHFFRKYPNPNEVRIERDAMRKLQSYSWPGNIRQLENEIRRSFALGKGSLSEEFFSHLDEQLASCGDVPTTLNLAELERWAIEKALEASNGQKSAAARVLGIPRRTLYEKLKRM